MPGWGRWAGSLKSSFGAAPGKPGRSAAASNRRLGSGPVRVLPAPYKQPSRAGHSAWLPRKWSAGRVRSCGFGPGFEGDVIAEAFEAALEIGNSAAPTDLVETGVSEIAIGAAPGEHVIGGHDNLVRNGQGGTQRAAPGHEAVKLSLK